MDNSNKRLSHKIHTVVLIALAFVINGCSDIDSEDIKTSGIYASMRLTATGNNQTNVWVSLSTGSGIFDDDVDLSSGDYLTATANGITKTLDHSYPYETNFDLDEGGTEFVVSLQRRDGVDAPDSIVSLPTKFSIHMPDASQVFNTGETITVAWSPFDNTKQIGVTYNVECFMAVTGMSNRFGRSYTINDLGIHTVPVNGVLDTFGEQSQFDTSVPCATSITVERIASGSVDLNYGQGGVITAKQIRNIGIIINP